MRIEFEGKIGYKMLVKNRIEQIEPLSHRATDTEFETLAFLDLGSRDNADVSQLKSVFQRLLGQGRIGTVPARGAGENWWRVIAGGGTCETNLEEENVIFPLWLSLIKIFVQELVENSEPKWSFNLTY